MWAYNQLQIHYRYSRRVMSLTSEMRRNKKLFIGLLVAAAVVYYVMRPGEPVTRMIQRDDGKVRYPVSHFLKEVKRNDTFFNAIASQKYIHTNTVDALKTYLLSNTFSSSIPSEQLTVGSNFDIERDVIVYLHIQKVGGTTFNSHLMNDLFLENPCTCQKDMVTNPCLCKNKRGNIWLFSWFSVGWPCGLHADWTMLHECVDGVLNTLEGTQRSRRYFYIALLRDPVTRYLSEWKHLRSGKHWKDTKLRCNYQPVSLFDVRPCFTTDTWEGVSLNEFMNCPDNLATNRQTRMLANLSKCFCYHRNKAKYHIRGGLQLESALENLKDMAFIGLTENQMDTQKLFEKTFNVKFKKDFEPLEEPEDEKVSEDEFIRMFQYIELDVILYQYAKDLFQGRVKKIT